MLVASSNIKAIAIKNTLDERLRVIRLWSISSLFLSKILLANGVYLRSISKSEVTTEGVANQSIHLAGQRVKVLALQKNSLTA